MFWVGSTFLQNLLSWCCFHGFSLRCVFKKRPREKVSSLSVLSFFTISLLAFVICRRNSWQDVGFYWSYCSFDWIYSAGIGWCLLQIWLFLLIIFMLPITSSLSIMWNLGLKPLSSRRSSTSSNVEVSSFPVLFLSGRIRISLASQQCTNVVRLFSQLFSEKAVWTRRRNDERYENNISTIGSCIGLKQHHTDK